MKTVALMSMLLTAAFILHSQPTAPAQPVAPQQNPPPVNSGNMPPPNNVVVPGAPNQAPTNPPDTNNPAATNAMGTNQMNPTNQEMAAQATNNPETNANPAMASALALTNRLSVMAPAQVQNVVNVQVGINSLQQIAINIGGVENVQQVIQRNPQAQQQLQLVNGQIIQLARGAKPSEEVVERLSLDLLRGFRRAHLRREHQLVLAIIINEACNCETLTAPQFSAAVNNGLLVLRNDGIAPAFCNSIGCDLNSLALEIQPNLGI